MKALIAIKTIARDLDREVAKLETELRHLTREARLAELDVDASPPPDAEVTEGSDAAERRIKVLATAEQEWRRGVREPPGEGWQRIGEYIRGAQGLGWSWEKPYVANRQFAWCGAFASWCFGAARLKASIRRDVMPSCYRLHRWARKTTRLLKPAEIEPGDIAIVGPADGSGKAWGNHITLCTGVAHNGLETIEGNAKGQGVDGEKYEGVIVQFRPFEAEGRTYRVMYGVRMLEEDFE